MSNAKHETGDRLNVRPVGGVLRDNVIVAAVEQATIYRLVNKAGKSIRVIEDDGRLWYMTLLSAEEAEGHLSEDEVTA